MATFKYIQGNSESGLGVPNAVKYKLFRRHGGTDDEFDYEELDERGVVQPLVQVGGMMEKDEEKAAFKRLNFSGGITSMAILSGVMPRRKLTETGYRYYVTVEGEMHVDIYDKETQVFVPFKKVIYLDERGLDGTEPYVNAPNFRVYQDLVTDKTNRPDGIYVHIGYGIGIETGNSEKVVEDFVKIYSIDLTQTDIVGATIVQDASVNEYANILERAQGYFHTEYLPLACLTNDVNWLGNAYACAGPFFPSKANSDDIKMAFFDKNLNFRGRVTAGELYAAAGAGDITWVEDPQYGLWLTVDDVKGFARDIYDKNHLNVETQPAFVVFSSVTGSPSDRVSLREPYFPMFAIEKKLVEEEKLDPSVENFLVVQAIADGLFYLDSPYSRAICYECQYEY